MNIYDTLGNLWTATRGGATMTLTYDKAGRKLTMSDPDMGNWSYEYDALGSMTYQTDARDCVTHIEYDELNRPTDKTYSNCPATAAVAYDYDQGTNGKGRRTSMTDGSGSTNWFYDPRGRVWKETKVISGSSFETEWTYNSADLPKTMKYPDGEIVTTHYNNNMLPIDVIGANTYVSSMTYDSASRLLTRALGNGLTQTYDYYDWNQQGGRLETLVTGSLQNLAYVYDPVGNISQITNSTAGETSVYGYDALDRLTSWQLNQEPPETYEYDEDTGNLTDKNELALDYPDASGSDPTHPHAVTSAAINDVIVNAYEYDQNGNQTTREIGPDTFDLTYDAENRLVEVQKNDATIALFTFDGDGKRVKSVMDGETILFAGGHYEKKGSTITKYYMAGASRVAMRKYTIPQSMEVEYMLGDHLGSTSLTTDANGVKISELRYKPWGETRYTWTDAPATTPTYELTKYQYTGQYSYDTEFGLKFYGARFYDSAVGRFVSADTIIPSGTQGYDRYAYTNNNPVRYVDPDGHNPLLAVALLIGVATIGGAIGGAIGYTVGTAISGQKFDKTSFWVSTIGGGLTTGAATAVGIFGGGPGGFIAIMAVGTAATYAVDEELHGNDISLLDPVDRVAVTGQLAIGAIAGVIGGPTSVSFVGGTMKGMAIDLTGETMYQTTKAAGKMFLDELAVESIITAGKSSVATTVSTFATEVIKPWYESLDDFFYPE